jgi:hypothetical protein
MRAFCALGSVAAVLLFMPVIASAQVLYLDNFDTDTSANWTINARNPGDDRATFSFDYSTSFIPPAPGSGGTTRGLKLEANLADGVFSGVSVSPNGQSFSGSYVMRFHAWQNFNGPMPLGGNGSTQLTTAGVSTSGANAQWPGGTVDSVMVGVTGDGGSSIDYRAYVGGPSFTGAPLTETSGAYAAGTGVGVRNNTDPYYAPLGGGTPPADQRTAFPQQTGSAGAGAPAFAWREWVITVDNGTVTWSIDNRLLATISPTTSPDPFSTDGNIFLGQSDINDASSSDPNDTFLLFGLIDNLQVTVIPEPAGLPLLALGALACLRRRR